jgi:hypothetical protein
MATVQELEKQLEDAMASLPEAFTRGSGTLAHQIDAYVAFQNESYVQTTQACLAALPDTRNRPLLDRILGLLDRANAEAQLAVRLRQSLQELADAAQNAASQP